VEKGRDIVGRGPTHRHAFRAHPPFPPRSWVPRRNGFLRRRIIDAEAAADMLT
jgi:hypothetical protein